MLSRLSRALRIGFSADQPGRHDRYRATAFRCCAGRVPPHDHGEGHHLQRLHAAQGFARSLPNWRILLPMIHSCSPAASGVAVAQPGVSAGHVRSARQRSGVLRTCARMARLCRTLPSNDQMAYSSGGDLLRHVQLISLYYSPARLFLPTSQPTTGSGWRAERAMASGFLAWMCELSAAGGQWQ